MNVDWSISVGNLLTIASFLIGGLFFIARLEKKIEVFDVRLRLVEDTLKTFRDILERLARQEERLNSIESRVEDVRHGRGFIFSPGDWSHGPVAPNAHRKTHD